MTKIMWATISWLGLLNVCFATHGVFFYFQCVCCINNLILFANKASYMQINSAATARRATFMNKKLEHRKLRSHVRSWWLLHYSKETYEQPLYTPRIICCGYYGVNSAHLGSICHCKNGQLFQIENNIGPSQRRWKISANWFARGINLSYEDFEIGSR